MKMIHKEALEISFKHQYKIKKIFSEILGTHDIEHFSLDLVNPDSEMVFFSGTPSHAFEICNRGLGEYDGIISPEHYENYEFYWWKEAHHKAFANKIQAIRSGILGLKYGFMLVRKWNNFHLIYSFATKSRNLEFQTKVINSINDLLRVGDWAYEEIRPLYANYSGIYEPPKIDVFYQFEGGKPPSRRTKKFLVTKKNKTNILYFPNLQKKYENS